ncbi:hypothetical protein JCM15831A_11000 [Asaia astilbis]
MVSVADINRADYALKLAAHRLFALSGGKPEREADEFNAQGNQCLEAANYLIDWIGSPVNRATATESAQ